jgi:hypothetical protein
MKHLSSAVSCTLVAAALRCGHLEDYNMYFSNRYLVLLFLTAALAAPVAIMAVPAPQDAHDQNRIYDKDHKDYHEWNDNENRAWQHYLSENHHKSYEFSKANEKQQSQYWNWRHSHPDKG